MFGDIPRVKLFSGYSAVRGAVEPTPARSPACGGSGPVGDGEQVAGCGEHPGVRLDQASGVEQGSDVWTSGF